MIGTKTEEMGSRKKLLAPVVVLLLCVVSLTGAAYAYTSSMANTSNTLDADYLSIDLKGKGTEQTIDDDIVVGTGSLIQFQDHFEYAGANHASKTNLVTYTLSEDVVVVTYHLRVESDIAGPVNLIVSSANLANVKLYTYNESNVMLTDKYNTTFKVGDNEAKTILLTGEAGAANKQSVAVNTDLTVQIIFTLKDGETGPFNIGTRAAVGTTASDYATAFAAANNNVFALTFTADTN